MDLEPKTSDENILVLDENGADEVTRDQNAPQWHGSENPHVEHSTSHDDKAGTEESQEGGKSSEATNESRTASRKRNRSIESSSSDSNTSSRDSSRKKKRRLLSKESSEASMHSDHSSDESAKEEVSSSSSSSSSEENPSSVADGCEECQRLEARIAAMSNNMDRTLDIEELKRMLLRSRNIDAELDEIIGNADGLDDVKVQRLNSLMAERRVLTVKVSEKFEQLIDRNIFLESQLSILALPDLHEDFGFGGFGEDGLGTGLPADYLGQWIEDPDYNGPPGIVQLHMEEGAFESQENQIPDLSDEYVSQLPHHGEASNADVALSTH